MAPPLDPRRPLAPALALAALGLVAACGSSNPYAGSDEPLFRGRPTAFWLQELRYDLPRGYPSDAVLALAHLAPADPRAETVVEGLMVDQDGEVRRSAFAAVAELEPDYAARFEAALVAGLDDRHPPAASQALLSLCALHARGAELPALRTAIEGLSVRYDLAWSPVLDRAARDLVGPDALGGGDADLGLLVAETTLRLALRPEPLYLDTLAWAHYRRGELDRAVSLARQARAEAETAGLPASQRVVIEQTLSRFTSE
jgi:hypothetical protein